MHQILFRLPDFLPKIGGAPIYGYGLMMVIGFFAAMELAKFLARRSKIDPEIFANAALIALVAGVVGARLSHVLENIQEYTRSDLSFAQNLWNAINIRSGGLTYYGGFLLAFPAVVAYGWYKKVPIRLGMDIVAPCVVIGLGFGRIGCFLNGCCYGAETNAPWAVQFPYHSDAYMEQFYSGEIQVPHELIDANGYPRSIDQIEADRTLTRQERADLVNLARSQHALPVHPAELYSTMTAWLIAALLVAYFTLPHAPGRVFALMLIVEGVSRFLLEMVRAEPQGTFFGHHIFGPLTFSEGLSIPIALLGVVLWFAFGAKSLWPEPHPALA
ncbi:MAG TPA: prolipoprotein diacylglyceryl transferase [Tepidisphaeraceae bacterium]|jgi:phosphatidylglycerol:prolipoprotein diacylglycerol transferase|nr:prolipoprotein diacylglyceryl transferase [Tepidisphaeraceae bacterium]